jgi:hypothetical protein
MSVKVIKRYCCGEGRLHCVIDPAAGNQVTIAIRAFALGQQGTR